MEAFRLGVLQIQELSQSEHLVSEERAFMQMSAVLL